MFHVEHPSLRDVTSSPRARQNVPRGTSTRTPKAFGGDVRWPSLYPDSARTRDANLPGRWCTSRSRSKPLEGGTNHTSSAGCTPVLDSRRAQTQSLGAPAPRAKRPSNRSNLACQESPWQEHQRAVLRTACVERAPTGRSSSRRTPSATSRMRCARRSDTPPSRRRAVFGDATAQPDGRSQTARPHGEGTAERVCAPRDPAGTPEGSSPSRHPRGREVEARNFFARGGSPGRCGGEGTRSLR
jgi:hypothetical protein